MKNELHLERRMQTDLIVSEEIYISSIFDIVQWLLIDMEEYVKEENRFFGIMPTYFSTMSSVVSDFNTGLTEDDCSIFGKVFYLLKPLLVNEFSRLENKRLSKADRLIVMSKRILDLLEQVGTELNYDKMRLGSIKVVNTIITKMFDRIRNDGKNTELRFMTKTIKDCIESGQVGRLEIHSFSMENEIERRSNYKQQPVQNNIIMEETSGRTVWKEEL